jgi:uncharacterized membrane protein (UPF0182 family)
LFPTLLILGALLVTFALFVGFYTDWLWYSDAGYSGVFTKQLWVRALLFVAFFLLAAAVVVLNGYLAYRFRPIFRAISLDQQSLDRYRLALDPFRRLLLIAFGGLVGFFFGAAALAEWRTVLGWLNRTPFNATDPQFNVDISFYVFTLPWLRFLVDSAMVLVVISGLVAAAVHYLYGGISPQSAGERTTGAARIQLSILIGTFVLLKAASYWLDRYELLLDNNTLFTGAGYTDINAVLPAKTILTLIALISAALFFINTFRGTWRLAVLSLGLMVLSALAIGGIWPEIVQRIQVSPTQNVKESPFIQLNIDATLDAYELDEVETQPYAAQTDPNPEQVREARGTIENVRLMDPGVLSATFDQLQQVKGFYTFQDPLDVDRYEIDGKQADVIVAPRELDLDGVPIEQRNWINDHLTYTHGFGLVAAYGNRAQANGNPVFAESELPPVGVLDIDQPRIYFGEQVEDYSIVGVQEGVAPKELDFPDATAENGQRAYTYTGEGGVPIGSFLNRLAYAWKYQETDIMLSQSISSESEILYIRDPRERVERVAPWLTLDADPYATVIDGRVVWIIDGYTTTNNFPYAQRQFFGEATTDSLTAQSGPALAPVRDQINYLRNSVKATVDAYDGTVTLYAWDEEDPIMQTWSKAFPGTVEPKDSISDELMAHLRYPEDMFKVQREIYQRYHVTDPRIFFSSQAAWQVPTDPTSSGVGDVAQPPYYLTLRMPGTAAASFSLTTTYAPVNRENLAAFMAVNSDARDPDYGLIRVLELPDNSPVPGPSQMQNAFESNDAVANELLALRRGGSVETVLGNLLTLPVADGLMYVEPIFVRATEGAAYPTLRKVMVSFGGEVAIEDTFPEALAFFFEEIEPGGGGGGGGGGGDNEPGTDDAQARLTQALDDAAAAYEAGQAALAEGDFAAYGEAQADLQAALERATEAAAELGIQTPTEPSPTPTPSEEATPASFTIRGARVPALD